MSLKIMTAMKWVLACETLHGHNLDFCITEVKNLEQDCAETSTTEGANSLGCSTTYPLPLLLKCWVDQTFLTLCLAKLVCHTASKTYTSVANVFFHQIVTYVKERIVEELSYGTKYCKKKNKLAHPNLQRTVSQIWIEICASDCDGKQWCDCRSRHFGGLKSTALKINPRIFSSMFCGLRKTVACCITTE